MYYDVMAAGFGGQGIVQLGRVLALTGMLEGRHVTCIASYGAEMRGGTANSMVVVSTEEIGSPVVNQFKSLIAMNGPSLEKFGPRVKPGGLIILNTSLVKHVACTQFAQVELVGVAASQLAEDLGNIRMANIVALGAFVAHTKVFSQDVAREAISEVFAGRHQNLIAQNIKALQWGAQGVQVLRCLQ